MLAELEIGPLTLQTFGVCFAAAFVACGFLLSRRFHELGLSRDWAWEVILAALVGGIIGARLYFVADHWDAFTEDPFGEIFSGSGLVWYGGAAGGAASVIGWARWRNFLNLTLLDTCGIGLALGYAIGRIGCQVSGDGDYGKPWDGPWAMSYPEGVVPTDEKVHPTPVYETLTMLLVAWLLWRLRDRFRPGILFAAYLVFAGVERFAVEFLRRNPDVFIGLTAAQLQSAALFAAGAVWLGRAATSSEGLPRASA